MDFHRINDQGKLWIQRVDDISLIGHTVNDEGRLVYSKSDDKVYIATSTEWLELAIEYSVISTGTKMLFGSYPLPTGWNITAYDDIMVTITNNSVYVGSTNGSWYITGLQSDGSHDHTGLTGKCTITAHIGGDVIQIAHADHKHSILADGLHTHEFDGQWRPNHVKFCEASLQ